MTELMTHVYIGPTTIYGLRQGSACRKLGRARGAAGAVLIATKDERRWIVQGSLVEAHAR